MSGNESKSGLIRSIGGWNNTSMSRRTNPTNGRLARGISQSLRTTGGGIPNPSLGIGTIRIAMPQNAAGTNRPTIVRISGADGDPNATTFRQNPTFTTRIATITTDTIQTVLPANNINTLNSVEIGNLVTSIGVNAFTSASNSLTTVEFKQFGNARLREIGGSAFSNCGQLTGTLRIPGSVATIGSFAFDNCGSLESIDLASADALVSIGDRAFEACGSASGPLTIPASVATIGNFAFEDCGSLASIDLANAAALVNIGNYAFEDCTSATGTLRIPGSVATIGDSAFQECGSLASIDLVSAAALVNIDDYAFRDCTSATGTLTIPGSVATIAAAAFDNCGSLDEVSFVSSTQDVTIGNDAFSGLTLIAGGTPLSNLSGTTLNRNVPGGIEFYPPASDSLFRSGANATGASVALINTTLVSNAKTNLGGSMDTATVGALVTQIGERAFTAVANSLTELTIRPGGSLATITFRAFDSCTNLKSIDLANATSLVTIGNFAFVNCGSATGALIIPDSVTSIGGGAFSECGSLASIDLASAAALVTINQLAFNSCARAAGTLRILGSVVTIGRQAFDGCRSLESIDLSSAAALVNIGDYAFSNCGSAAGTLTIPSSVATIGASAFRNCGSLASIDLANAAALVNIGDQAFLGCASATGALTIPSSVATIGNVAFQECGSLAEITFVSSTTPVTFATGANSPFTGLGFVSDGTALTGLSEIDRNIANGRVFFKSTQDTRFFNADQSAQQTTNAQLIEFVQIRSAESALGVVAIAEIGTQVTSIAYRAFSDARNDLTKLTIRPNGSLATIGIQAFELCVSLASIDLASAAALTDIGDIAFRSCTGAAGTLTIPSSVATIGDQAFGGCGSLVSIDLASAASLVSIGEEAFDGCESAAGALTIPGSVATIGNLAFQNCTSLSEISFVSSTTPVTFATDANSPFTGLGFTNASLGSLEGLSETDRSAGDVVFTKLQTIFSETRFFDTGRANTVTNASANLIQSIVSTADAALGNSLAIAEIGTQVTEIGVSAFSNARDTLTELNFGRAGSLASIGADAFNGCGSLASIDLASAAALVDIGDFAFRDCASATGTLTIPGSVATISNGAFRECGNLASIDLASASALVNIDRSAFRECGSLASIDLASADALVNIGEQAFFGCVSATGALTIPGSVATIGSTAFYLCGSLAEITFVSSAVASASVVSFVAGGSSPFLNMGFTNASLGSLQTLASVNRGSGDVVFTK